MLKKFEKSTMYRPPIDNEMLYLKDYEKVGIKDAKLVYQKRYKDTYSFDIIAKDTKLGEVDITYLLGETFKILLDAKFNHGLKMLARFGISFDIENEEIKYFGYGPHESYVDRHQGTTLGLYTLKPSDNYRYIKPQASGNHYGVYFVLVDDLMITSLKPFETSFDNVDIYTYPSHRYMIEESNVNTLYLDFMQSGVGSYACGPELLHKYRLDDDTIHFVLTFSKKQ